MFILFSCILAPAAKSYKIHLIAKEQNEFTIKIASTAFHISHREYYIIFSEKNQIFFCIKQIKEEKE
ncbi:hypothetical protein CJ485_17955 [Priestia filamentosa]|nr:hypothetical protein CJ485_17955 [Priestia filamentosa]